MKIKSIRKGQSGKNKLAFDTEPRLNMYVFGKFVGFCAKDEALRGLLVNNTAGVVTIEAKPRAELNISPELAESVSRLLTAAEEAVKADKVAEDQKKILEESGRQKTVDAAAKVFGVPVK